MSVLPIADIYFIDNDKPYVPGRLRFETAGLGPAKIEPVEMYLDGSRVETVPTFAEYFGTELPPTFKFKDDPFMDWFIPMLQPQIADASASWTILRMDAAKFEGLSSSSKRKFVCNLPERFWIKAKYCSVYGDCFVAESRNKNHNSDCHTMEF